MRNFNEEIVNLYNKAKNSWKLDDRRMKWLGTLANKALYWKLPRWGSTEMSPAIDNNTRMWLRKAPYQMHTLRTWTQEQKDALGKKQLLHWALYPYSAITDMIADVASVPVNFARNVYNTAADVYNAWVSERNAINQANLNNAYSASNLNKAAEQYRNNQQQIQPAIESPYLDNKYYWMWNQATLSTTNYWR